jgi:hypothetical protein
LKRRIRLPFSSATKRLNCAPPCAMADLLGGDRPAGALRHTHPHIHTPAHTHTRTRTRTRPRPRTRTRTRKRTRTRHVHAHANAHAHAHDTSYTCTRARTHAHTRLAVSARTSGHGASDGGSVGALELHAVGSSTASCGHNSPPAPPTQAPPSGASCAVSPRVRDPQRIDPQRIGLWAALRVCCGSVVAWVSGRCKRTGGGGGADVGCGTGRVSCPVKLASSVQSRPSAYRQSARARSHSGYAAGQCRLH